MDTNLIEIANRSLELAVEILMIKKGISINNSAYILFDAVARNTAFIQECMGVILSSESEDKSVHALKEAYQELASIKYYLNLIDNSKLLPSTIVLPLLKKSRSIMSSLEPYIVQYEGKYEEETDDELYNILSEYMESLLDNDSYDYLDD